MSIDAGDLGRWFLDICAVLDNRGESDVPCGECTACCTASQFVHIGPDEAPTLARIPADLLVPAPGLPSGHVLMGYDEHGRCPMLIAGQCSIYAERPKACRAYDCRVFAATGVIPDEPGKEAIAARVDAWQFSVSGPADQACLDALRAAGDLVSGQTPTAGLSATARALAALALVHG